MACGCGGDCCGQPKGLGFLSYYSDAAGGWWDDLSQGEYDWLMQNYGGGGGGDFWGLGNPFWGFDDAYTVGGRDYTYMPFLPEPRQLPPGAPDVPYVPWSLPGWIDDLVAPFFETPLPPGVPPCPPGYYYPDLDKGSYRCAPIDGEPARRKAARQQRQGQSQGQQQQRRSQQSGAQQRCPERTVFNPLTQRCERACPPGMQPNAQAVCACPSGLIYSVTYQRCVLPSQLTATDKQALQAPNWLLYLALALGVVAIVKR